MRTLSLGIFAEGSTDIEFLSPVLVRLASRLIEAMGHHPAQIADVDALPGRPSRDVFRNTLHEHARSLDMVLVHMDANGDLERAIEERINPWFESVRDLFGERLQLVGLVPARETEAWMLCDFRALSNVLGTRKQRSELGLPSRAREVEQITNPKAALKEAQTMALGKRQARKVGLRPLYPALGQEVSLDELYKLPAFIQFASAFEDALRRLGFLSSSG